MKPELIAPAGDFISLRAAIDAGADAVYFGIKELNLRLGAKNFELKDTKKVIDLCHKNNIKAYLTLNSIIYDNEIERIRKILKKLKKEKIDAVICWDFSVIRECEKLNIPIHLSTQASISNFKALYFLYKKIKNLKRIVLARELTLKQIKEIIKNIRNKKLNLQIETFVHGAMCVSISGRCFLSQEIFQKSANRGECLQPCRRKYLIYEPEDSYGLKLGENYIMSPKDLCALPFIDKLIDAGINAFKIEGRNRSPEYVKVVTECYREIIDYLTKPIEKKSIENIFFKNKKIKQKEEISESQKQDTHSEEPSEEVMANNKNSIVFLKNKIKQKKESDITQTEYSRSELLGKELLENLKNYNKIKNQIIKKNIEKLKTVYNRGFSSGFYFGMPTAKEFTDRYGSKAIAKKVYIGKIKNYYKKICVAEIKLETGSLRVGEKIMIQGPTTGVVEQNITSIEKKHKKITKAKKGQLIAIKIDKLVRENDKVYLIK